MPLNTSVSLCSYSPSTSWPFGIDKMGYLLWLLERVKVHLIGIDFHRRDDPLPTKKE